MTSTSSPEQPAPKKLQRTVLILIALLLVIVLATQIGNLRAHWWAYRLARAEDPATQALCLGQITAIGSAAESALRRLARSDRSELRHLIIPASHGLNRFERAELLIALLDDPDDDIRLDAATAMAFMDQGPGRTYLKVLLKDPRARVATAASAGLARVPTTEAVETLCNAIRKHPDSMVRAQSIESLIQHLKYATPGKPVCGVSMAAICLSLARALEDNDRFEGQLALEREIENVSAVVTSRTGSPTTATIVPSDRSVSEVTAALLVELTGQRISASPPERPADINALAQQIEDALSKRATRQDKRPTTAPSKKLPPGV